MKSVILAQQLKAHGHALFYYDNRQKGEVDFLIDNYDQLSVLPIEVNMPIYYVMFMDINEQPEENVYF